MTRARSSRWLALPVRVLGALLLITLAASSAWADKPKVAILGLEVYEPSGNIDQPSTAVARDLTEGLRLRAKSGTGPFQLAAGSEKELIDEKLINGCDSEAIACMAEIGKSLGADYLMYGRVERKPDGYAVTINLLNVNKKKFERARTPLIIPFTQRDATSLAAAARQAYNDLTGVSALGTLVIKANVERGTVFLDDEPRGSLASGSATISSLPEGRYRLAIEADGYQRGQEVVITIRSGEITTQPVTLTALDGGGAPGGALGITRKAARKTNLWKPTFVGLAAVSAGLGGYSLWRWTQWRDGVEAIPKPAPGAPAITPASCGSAQTGTPLADVCDKRRHNIYAGIAAAGVGGLAVMAFYMGFLRDADEAPTASVAGHRTKKRPFTVTPIVSADGGGATVQLDW